MGGTPGCPFSMILIGLLQRCGVHPALDEFISTTESALGIVLDWKTTAFWRSSSFRSAWAAFQRRTQQRQPSKGAVLEALCQDGCACVLQPLMNASVHYHAQ